MNAARRPRPHPFHWSVYSPLYDKLNGIASSEDPRISIGVAGLVGEARQKLWEAWNLQTEEERAAAKT